jgi:hypothetical protein
MGCFSLTWLEQILIDVVLIIGFVMIIQLFLPRLTAMLGPFVWIIAILRIVLWVAIAIFVIIICFSLFECLIGSGGISLVPHAHSDRY